MDKNQLRSLFISTQSTVKEAVQLLNDTGLKIIFVVDPHEKLLGTLSDGDIRRGILAGLSLAAPVDKVMKTNFRALPAETPELPKAALAMMQQHMIEQVPIVDAHGVIIDVLLWVDFLGERNEASLKSTLKRDNSVVIMAGGKGSRLDPFTKVLPKPLIPVGDKPIIETIMDRFYENGFSRFILVINYKKEMIKAYFGERSLPYHITFVEEQEFCGTAGGLSLLRDTLTETFVVTNCDTVLEGNYNDLFQWHCEHGNVMTIIGSHKEITVPYGVLCMNNGFLDRIDEKPKLDLFINTGTYIFEPGVFEFIKDHHHLDMDKLILIIKEQQADRIGVYPHWGGWFDVGQWDEYRKSLKELGGA